MATHRRHLPEDNDLNNIFLYGNMIGSSTTNLAIIAALFAILSGTLFVSAHGFGALESAAAQESEVMSPLTLKTDNGSVNVIVSWEPQEI